MDSRHHPQSHPGIPGVSSGDGVTSISVFGKLANYDDQGLFFSLILCTALLLFFVPVTCFLSGTSKLWLKRLYRPNHTIEPPPFQDLPEGSPLLSPSSPFPLHEVDGATDSHMSRRVSGVRRPKRRKRLGVSLPYRPTMFQLPSWRDWLSVEEQLPHLESALSPHHVEHVVPARFTGARSYMPLSPTKRPAAASPFTAGSPTARDVVVQGQPPAGSARAGAHRTTVASGASPSTLLPVAAGAEEKVATQSLYGAVETTDAWPRVAPPKTATTTTAAATAAAAAAASERPSVAGAGVGVEVSELPKTPLDPQIAMYIFTLKFFATLMLLGEVFTIWICAIASQDDYNEYTVVQLDANRCHRHDNNATTCMAKSPYCTYVDEDSGCVPVSLAGLYDLTAKNIAPGSWRWWPVVFLNAGFCAVMVLATLYFLRHAGAYVDAVMQNQVAHALGYRVACLRGIDADEMRSVKKFSASFLELRSYFPPTPAQLRAEREARRKGPTTAQRSPPAAGRPHSTDSTSADEAAAPATALVAASDGDADSDDYYEQMDCSGFGCLLGVVGCHYYTTYRHDAVFTQRGKVKQILFTRKPPAGIYSAIHAAESDMADLQDAIADEKALRRQLRRRHLREQQQQQQSMAMTPTPTPRADAASSVVVDSAVSAPPVTSPTSSTRRVFQNRSLLRSMIAPAASSASSSTTLSASSSDSEVEEGAAYQPISVGSFSPTPAPSPPPREGTLRIEVPPSQPPTPAAAAAAAASPRYESNTFFDSRRSQHDFDNVVLLTRTSVLSCCHEVPAVQYYKGHLRRSAAKLNVLLSQVPQQPADSATFVIFADARSAHEFSNLFNARYGGCLAGTSANIAGPPGQVIANNLLTDKLVLGLRFCAVAVMYVVLLFSYSIPIGMLGSLDSLSYMPGIGSSFSEYYVEKVPDWLRAIINAYLPVIALSLFYLILPDILRFMVMIMGAFNKAEVESGQLYLQYIFMVLSAVVFQAALQGGFAQLAFVATAGQGRLVTSFFVELVTPSRVSYFYAKVLVGIGLSAWTDPVDPVGLLKAFLLRSRVHVQRNYDALFMPCEFELSKRYSFDLMILAMGLLFHMTMPLLGLFVALFFFVRYATQRAKLYDRYRPTLSPAQDCTDFGISVQVIRAVMWLFCLAETGNVLLLSLRQHSGGVVVCSTTLATGMVLLVYVHVKTRRWIVSLDRVRQLNVTASAVAAAQARWRQQQWNTTECTARTPTAPGGLSERESSTAGGDLSAGSRTASKVFSPTDATPTGDSVGTDAAAAGPSTAAGERHAIVDESVMDTYENLRFTLFDDSNSNPFIGYLLPRIPDVSCRYQPKHQRLAPLDVDGEVLRMQQSVFVVERYWDKGMTWFEADVDDTQSFTRRASTAQRRPGGTRRATFVVEASSPDEAVELAGTAGQPKPTPLTAHSSSSAVEDSRARGNEGDEGDEPIVDAPSVAPLPQRPVRRSLERFSDTEEDASLPGTGISRRASSTKDK